MVLHASICTTCLICDPYASLLPAGGGVWGLPAGVGEWFPGSLLLPVQPVQPVLGVAEGTGRSRTPAAACFCLLRPDPAESAAGGRLVEVAKLSKPQATVATACGLSFLENPAWLQQTPHFREWRNISGAGGAQSLSFIFIGG